MKSKLPTLEEAEERLNRCQHCYCSEYSKSCRCFCHEIEAWAVLKQALDEQKAK